MFNLQGQILEIFTIAGPLALVLALSVLHFYRRAVAHEMRNAPLGAAPPTSDKDERGAPRAPLAFSVENLREGIDLRPARSSQSWDPSLGAAVVYVAGGLAFGIVATLLVFGFSATEFFPIRTLVAVWAYGWPTVLTLNILWSGDRRRQLTVVAIYAGVIGLCCVWVAPGSRSAATTIGGIEFPGFLNPVLFWAIISAPSAYLLLFANRRVRAVGPVILAFTALLPVGSLLAMALLGTPSGLRAAAFLFDATGFGAVAILVATLLAGLVIGAPAGWFAVRALASAHDARRMSGQSLVIDSIWLIQGLLVCSEIASENGYWGAAGLAAFAAYKLTTLAGFRLFAYGARTPMRLLLLRVFGFDSRSSRLFDLVASRWRYLGPIRLIAGSDLASRTIDPGKLIAFVQGRLRNLFVYNESELANRIKELDERPDPDGRFRVSELFCAGEVWRSAVRRLIADTDLVIMDLRSFSKKHEGCAFELQTLLDAAPLDRLVLLVDRDTDVDLLKSLLEARWRELSAASPNVSAANPSLPLLKVDEAESAIVRRLMRRAARFEEEAHRRLSSATGVHALQ
jgi:hypothetical protein